MAKNYRNMKIKPISFGNLSRKEWAPHTSPHMYLSLGSLLSSSMDLELLENPFIKEDIDRSTH